MINNEYIDGNKQKGIVINWKKVFKRFRELDIPKNIWTPLKIDFRKAKWFILLSERSRGKTTSILLLFMICAYDYDAQIQYIRQRAEHIAPKRAGEIFKTVLEYDYISKITKGRWNSVVYKSKKWFFCNRDEEGNETERANSHFMYMMSLDEAENYKSSYNAPKGDFILYDEFLSNKIYYHNEFVTLCDLIKTVIRDRISPVIVLSANMVDMHSKYFQELEIEEEIEQMKSGESAIHTTPKGTSVYVEILPRGALVDENKRISNSLFFGFSNPLLTNITGEDWAIDNYPHIQRDEKREIISTNHYIKHNGKLVNLKLGVSPQLGLHVLVHLATNTYDDSVIYTIDEKTDKRMRHKFGEDRLDKLFWKLYERDKWFYSTNNLGSLIDNYIKCCR